MVEISDIEISRKTAKEAQDEDLETFRFLLVEYADAKPEHCTQGALDLKYELIKILNRNGWYRKS